MATDSEPSETELAETDALANDLLARMLKPSETPFAGTVCLNHEVILNGVIRAVAMWIGMGFPVADDREAAIEAMADLITSGAEFYIEQGLPQPVAGQSN